MPMRLRLYMKYLLFKTNFLETRPDQCQTILTDIFSYAGFNESLSTSRKQHNQPPAARAY